MAKNLAPSAPSKTATITGKAPTAPAAGQSNKAKP